MKRLIVTRPLAQCGLWVEALRAAGFDALALPLIGIGPALDQQALQDAWAVLHGFEAVMFVSANAVDHFFAARPFAPSLAQALGTARLLATGPGSVAALLRAGVPAHSIDAPDAQSGQFDSEALWAVVQDAVRPGTRVLIVRGDSASEEGGLDAVAPVDAAAPSNGVGRDWFAQQVHSRGGLCQFVVAYRRGLPALGPNAVALIQVASRDGSIWLFSSTEAVRNLHQLAPAQPWHGARALATHARIADAARAMGFGSVHVSRPALPDLIASIESLP